MVEISFQVRWGRESSSTRWTGEGLPQGFPMSPVLFNIYVAKLPTLTKKKFLGVYQFADEKAVLAAGRDIRSAQVKVDRDLQKVQCFAEQ